MARLRLALAVLLLLASLQASADWMKLEEHATAVLYFDPENVIKDGILRRVWTLQDRKIPDGVVLSRRAQWEFDCKALRVRMMYLSSHRDHMALGTPVVSDDKAGPWGPVGPDSVNKTILTLACAR